MKETEFRVYGYRWVMLSVYMLAIAVNQIMWITFAPITKDAAAFFGVTDLQIGLLSMSFMIVYLIVSIPASWIIDTYGIRAGVGAGVVLTGVFGLLRGIFASDYNLLLIFQIGIAVGQPFLLNSITKVASRWFPVSERATASGLGTLAMYFGILLGMSLTPFLVNGRNIDGMLKLYGMVSMATAIIFFILARERPVTPPCRPDQEERALAIDGMRLLFRNRDFLWLMLIFFIGLGVFNSVTTWIENILSPRGFSAEQAGITGGLMILGGVVGALIMPILSDRFRKRVPFIQLALAGATISLAGVTFTGNYTLLLVSAAAFGFFLLSSGPIGFQYGAEVTFPVSEGTSNGFLLLMGQVSGIAFIFGMDWFKSPVTGSMTMPLSVLCILMLISYFLSSRLKESAFLAGNQKGDV
ncbi:MAG: MFS transporter [Bacteroidales bacterium]|jgi:cyanate permease|nr:MFS transporter [Bacteroidales bacterium]MDX9928123.1 MFS transporter [Bacteroidales bacterium]HNX83301.1 MFS transporter [Bacteroidales bacterium]HOC48144.1 MFS transporter [Bacteroidales bacterium]HPS97038.1 MFS transporter [Bacteroidales bacterium]